MRLPDEAEIASARRLVILMGLGYLVAQLVLFSADRAPGWDEAIYLSQVAPGAQPLLFAPSRARGITFLVAPVLQLGGSVPAVRLFLVLASAAALIGCFRMWVPVLGRAAPAAALVFAGSWPTLFYGSEVMPNLWAAFPGVGAVAVLARRLAGRRGRYDELIAGGLVALMALVRPLDALVLAVVLVLAPLLLRRGSFAWASHVLLGLLAGWSPWLVEMSGRFGGPLAALGSAARVGHAGRFSLMENLRQYLALSDGPTAGPFTDPRVPIIGMLWLAGLTVLLVLGILEARRRGSLAVAVVPTLAGLALAAEYVAFTAVPAPRFLLPGLGLLSIATGLGLVRMLEGILHPSATGRPQMVGAFAAVILVTAWTASQLELAAKIDASVVGHRDAAERAGAEVRRLAGNEPCQVFSSASYPMVGYASGCRASPIESTAGTWHERAIRLERDGIHSFAVFEGEKPPAAPAGMSSVADVPAERGRSWFIFVFR
jgi:hypothetical protein